MFNSYLTRNYIQKRRLPLLVIVAAGFLGSVSSFLLSVSIGEFYVLYFSTDGSKGRLLGLLGIHMGSLSAFFVFFGFFLFLKIVAGYFERWLGFREGESFTREIRESLFAAQITHPESFFTKRSFGKYLLRYSNDLKAVNAYLVKGVLGFVRDFIFLSIGLVFLMMINMRMAIYLLLFSLVIAILIYRVAAYQKQYIQKSRSRRSSMLAYVASSFSRLTKLSSFGPDEKRIQRFNRKSGELYESNLQNYKCESVQLAIIPFLQFAMIGGLLVMITVSDNMVSHADALVFILLALMMLSPFRRLLKVPSILNKGHISLRKIESLLDKNPGYSEWHNKLVRPAV